MKSTNAVEVIIQATSPLLHSKPLSPHFGAATGAAASAAGASAAAASAAGAAAAVSADAGAGASWAIVIQGPASASATSAAPQSFLSAGLIARCLLTFILLIRFCC